MRSTFFLTSALAAVVAATPVMVTNTVIREVIETAVVTKTIGVDDSATPAAAPVQKDVDDAADSTVVEVVTASPSPAYQFGRKYAGSRGHGGRGSSQQQSQASVAVASSEASSEVAAPQTSVVVVVASSQAPSPVASQAASSSSSKASQAPVSSSAPVSTTSDSDLEAGTGADATYRHAVISHHNIHRANHSAPNVAWNDTLYEIANDIASTCSYGHSMDVRGGGYGQNIAGGMKANNVSGVITDLFYNGEVLAYANNWNNPSPNDYEVWGHFTQVVWKDTVSVACATADCSAQGLGNTGSGVPPYFTVCNYYGAGNMGGEYVKNVGKPLGRPTAAWNAGL